MNDDLGQHDAQPSSDFVDLSAATRTRRSPPSPVPSPSTPQPADFGDYRFVERLGKGAYGEVFKVWSSSKGRCEAMKVLQFDRTPKTERLEDFRREVQRMANVPGTHVAHVYHTGVLPDGRPYFTMEYLNGGRIDDFCNRNRETIEHRILLVAAVCDAVHKMHELNLVHCDIKPGNIVVTDESGTAIPKLVDFGLASALAFKESPSRTARGTLPYMAPEQLESRGGDPEGRWDIYALGVTLYQLLVDQRPIDNFPDPSLLPPEVLADYVRKTPIPPLVEKLPWDSTERTEKTANERRLSAETLRARLRDPWLEAIVGKALTKDRDERYASAGEMALNLRSYVKGRRPPIVPPTPRDRATEFLRDHSWAVTSATVLVIVAALFLWGYRAKIAARNEAVDKHFAQGCLELEPAVAIKNYQQALELDPTRSDIRLHLAGAYVTGGNAEQAAKIAQSISEGDPYFGHAQAFVRGFNQFRASPNGDPPPDFDMRPDVAPGEEYYYSLTFPPNEARSAILLLDRALEGRDLKHDDRFRIRLMRAMRYYQTGDFGRLSSEAQGLIDTVPDSAVVWNLQGISESKAGQKEKALLAYNKAITLNPQYAAVYRNRGELNCDMRRYVHALTDCERAVELNPSLKPFVLGVRINALLGKKEMAAARTECEALQRESVVTAQTHIACGIVWMEEESPERAWNEFDLAVKNPDRQFPRNYESEYSAIWNRGSAALERKWYLEAITDFNAAEVVQPGRWRLDPNSYVHRGVALLLAKMPGDAVADLSRAAELMKDDPERSLVHLWLWDVHLASGSVGQAAEALRLAAEAAKGDARMARIVGHCAGEVERETLMKDAASDSQKQAEAYYYIGLAAKARGDRDAARDCFESCLKRSAAGTSETELLAEMQLSLLRASP